MLIDEIEITGASLTLSVVVGCSELDASKLYSLVAEKGDEFNLDAEFPGFHDIDCCNGLLRGFYSYIEPFEVEELIDGITTKNLHKRIQSCEFITDGAKLFVFGHACAKKLLLCGMSALSGTQFGLHKFEHDEMLQAGNRMTPLKSVVLINSKEKEVRLARLSGSIENYTDYNVIDPRNHGVKSISGIMNTPLGPMNVSVKEKGTLSLGVKKGLIITFECLVWILDLVLGKHSGEIKSSQSSF